MPRRAQHTPHADLRQIIIDISYKRGYIVFITLTS